MSCKNYIRVETRLIASLQPTNFTNDLGLLYSGATLKMLFNFGITFKLLQHEKVC
ncbi:hypothetical protein [Dulcicalothrix desertica]|uniref:hypothetical protein n=1 Tax=Dulcicalothrix desertica TaxID=32056 RepID=UPI00119B0FF5|nr:hypothetical protein [Dulcicalothrix desertica]TWH44013.1 hypothetical protein CAL7102_07781 [Dulcicalothrix desertica PCC 7102]